MDLLDLHLSDPAAWRRFLAGRPHVPAPLQRCWERVRALGAPPEGPDSEPVVEGTALREHRERVGPLVEAFAETLKPAREMFEARDFRLLLADASGVVVHTAGGGGFADEAERVLLIEGSSWAEEVRGTNAIGTAIAENKPVSVSGAAHFARPNHGLVCYAAPIRDPFGNPLAIIDATSFAERRDPFAWLAITGAARALEDVLRERAFAALGPQETALVERVLSRFPGPAVLIENGGHIRRANEAALCLLADEGLAPTHLRARHAGLSHVTGCSEALLGHGWQALVDAGLRGAPLHHRRYRIELEPVVDRRGRMLAMVAFLATPHTVASPAPTPTVHAPNVGNAFEDVVGSDPHLVAARRTAAQLAPSTLPVLLLAETGTGKDRMARAIHAASHRSAGPFVALNCGAVSSSLLESELFGYGPGAFTGANRAGQLGQVAAADGGTLFLDELAEMPMPLQVLLLRFLEDGTYRRVGETATRHSDVRLVSATCRDLPALVAEGRFRPDLYYRLRGACIGLPPVRERDDLHLLVQVLIADLVQQCHLVTPAGIDVEASHWLSAQPWPGNLRELKNVLHRALVLAGPEATLRREHFPSDADLPAQPRIEPAPAAPSREDAERSALLNALTAAKDNVSAAARILGVARSTVYRMMRRHGL